MPPPRGRMRRRCCRSSDTTLLKPTGVPWASFTNCQKKRRVPNPSPYDASSPHRREQDQGDGRNTYESSPSRQNVAGVRQPRKRRVPKSLPRSRIHPFRRRLSKCSSRYGPAAIRRSAHLKGGWGTRLKVVETWLLLQRSLTSFLF